MELIDDIDDIEAFNPRAAIRRLKINIGNTIGPLTSSKDIIPESPGLRSVKQGEPTLSIYEGLDDVYVEYYPETVFFMCPQHIISYVYGSGVRYVTFELSSTDNPNELEVKIIDPPSLVQSNLGNASGVQSKQMKQAFNKKIDPQHLFKYLAQFDMNTVEYETTLNPVRYRHVLI